MTDDELVDAVCERLTETTGRLWSYREKARLAAWLDSDDRRHEIVDWLSLAPAPMEGRAFEVRMMLQRLLSGSGAQRSGFIPKV
jgi:hypothetical protein